MTRAQKMAAGCCNESQLRAAGSTSSGHAPPCAYGWRSCAGSCLGCTCGAPSTKTHPHRRSSLQLAPVNPRSRADCAAFPPATACHTLLSDAIRVLGSLFAIRSASLIVSLRQSHHAGKPNHNSRHPELMRCLGRYWVHWHIPRWPHSCRRRHTARVFDAAFHSGSTARISSSRAGATEPKNELAAAQYASEEEH